MHVNFLTGALQGTCASVRDSGFGNRDSIRYSAFTVFPDLRNFQDIWKYKSIQTKTEMKILPQPIIFGTNKALTYHKCWGKCPKCNKKLKKAIFGAPLAPDPEHKAN